jgi:hypothetical protein
MKEPFLLLFVFFRVAFLLAISFSSDDWLRSRIGTYTWEGEKMCIPLNSDIAVQAFNKVIRFVSFSENIVVIGSKLLVWTFWSCRR